jgi:hypothetical protein
MNGGSRTSHTIHSATMSSLQHRPLALQVGSLSSEAPMLLSDTNNLIDSATSD